MIIREGSAEEIHSWFLTEQTQEAVLCVFLGSANHQIAELSKLIDSVVEVDSILGRKIGFLICSGDRQTASELDLGYGERLMIGAQYKGAVGVQNRTLRTQMAKLDLHSFRHHGGDQYYREAIQSLARSTARLVPDFMELFGVRHSELPCIVTLFKGIDEFAITPCSTQVTKDQIVSWLESVRLIVDQVDEDILHADMRNIDMGMRIRMSSEYQREIGAKLKKVEVAATGICARHKVDSSAVLALLATLCSDSTTLFDKLEAVSAFCVNFPMAADDNRWEKIETLLQKVDETRQMDVHTLNRSELQALESKIRAEMQKISMILERVRNLKMEGGSSRYGTKRPNRRRLNSWEVAEKLNTAADIWDKLSTALAFILKLL